MTPLAWKFVLFGILGIFFETVFTGILDIFKNRRLRLMGFSFLWMFPIYGLLAFLFLPVYHQVSYQTWIVRGLVYMTGFYLVEFVSGTILTALTRSPIWQYTDRFNYKGQITLLYAPVWFGVGLLIEKYYPWVERAANALSVLPLPG